MAVISPYILHLLGRKNVNPKILKKLEGRMRGTSKRLTEEKEQAAPPEARKIDEYKDYTDEEKIWKTGESPEQLDRPKEVWERFDEELDEGIISPLDDPDPHLDRIHNKLIDEEVITQKYDYDPDLAPTGPEGIQPKRQTKKQIERSYERRQKEPVPETSDMTLEELQRTTNRPLEKVEPGEAHGLTRKEPTDQIDVLGRNRADALRATIDELPPHLQTPENIRILAKEIIQEDVSDKATGQAFGKSREAHPGVLDPDKENFSVRELEDVFVEGVKADTPQKRAVQRVRKEAAQAAEKSGRTKIIKDKSTGENRYIPKTHRRFIKDPKNIGNVRTNQQQLERLLGQSDQAPLEAVQEKLTGPLRPEVAEALELSKTKRGEKAGELRLDRQMKEPPGPESVPTEKMIAEFLDEAAPQEPSLFGQLPYEFAPGTRTSGKAAASKEAGKTRGDRLYNEFLKRKKREERDAYYEAQRAARRGQEKPPATQPETPARSDIPSQQQPSTEQVLNMLLSRFDRSNVEPDAIRVAVQQLKLQGLDNLEIFEVLQRTIANGR